METDDREAEAAEAAAPQRDPIKAKAARTFGYYVLNEKTSPEAQEARRKRRQDVHGLPVPIGDLGTLVPDDPKARAMLALEYVLSILNTFRERKKTALIGSIDELIAVPGDRESGNVSKKKAMEEVVFMAAAVMMRIYTMLHGRNPRDRDYDENEPAVKDKADLRVILERRGEMPKRLKDGINSMHRIETALKTKGPGGARCVYAAMAEADPFTYQLFLAMREKSTPDEDMLEVRKGGPLGEDLIPEEDIRVTDTAQEDMYDLHRGVDEPVVWDELDIQDDLPLNSRVGLAACIAEIQKIMTAETVERWIEDEDGDAIRCPIQEPFIIKTVAEIEKAYGTNTIDEFIEQFRAANNGRWWFNMRVDTTGTGFTVFDAISKTLKEHHATRCTRDIEAAAEARAVAEAIAAADAEADAEAAADARAEARARARARARAADAEAA